MLNWNLLNSIDQLSKIDKLSKTSPVVIFKHSISCSVSSMVKMRLESSWDLDIPIYYLDLINHRSISNEVSTRYKVYHESPQIILIFNGQSDYDASHFDISIEELKENLNYLGISI